MVVSDQPEIVTLVACPPEGTSGSTANSFIDAALETLESKRSSVNRIVRVSCVRDADIELGKILTRGSKHEIKLQLVGHSLPGKLLLGAAWIPEDEMTARAYKAPYFLLDTNPDSLGLLAKYVDRISEVMLVGCNVGSATSYGYAINGRTLTYTLAEMLRCLVRGADDVVAPGEFDAQGWYAPGPHHKRPKGWRWVEDLPPVWTAPGTDPVSGSRATTTRWFEIRSITRSLLPVPAAGRTVVLDPAIHLSCGRVAADVPASALPELSLDTDQGPAQLLCGGRYLRVADTCYFVDQTPELSAALTTSLWDAGAARGATPRARSVG
jgi:hypothetical protein